MKVWVLAAAVMMALAACSPAGDTRQKLIGRWGDNGDCSTPLIINADGSFGSSGAQGKWLLSGNHLTLSGAGGAFSVDLNWQDNDHVTVTHPDGSVGHSQRCS